MNISAPFIQRPVATSLLTIALLMAGALAYTMLPVAPLPQVEFPTINVNAALPGASPETMASAVATPLERQFGRIANVTQMTSSSQLGSTSIVLQFDLNRNIDAAARDVQAAINAARGQLPTNLPSNPTWRKVNPADAPILILSLTSDTATKPQMYDVGNSILAQKLSQIDGVGQVFVGGSSLPAVRAEVNPMQLSNLGVGIEQVRTALSSGERELAEGRAERNAQQEEMLQDNDQLFHAAQYAPQDHRVQEWRAGAACGCCDSGGLGGGRAYGGSGQRQAQRADHHFPAAGGEHYRDGGPRAGAAAAIAGVDPAVDQALTWLWTARRRSAHR